MMRSHVRQQWSGGIHNIKGVESGATYPTICGSNRFPSDFYSGLPEPTGSYSYQFMTPGTYLYICEPHCYDNMWGSITGMPSLYAPRTSSSFSCIHAPSPPLPPCL